MSDEKKVSTDVLSRIERLKKRAEAWKKQMKEPPSDDELEKIFNSGTPDEIAEALFKMIDEDNDKHGGPMPLYKGITF